MKSFRFSTFLLLLFLMFILIGCSKSSSSSDVTSDKPETVHKNFLYYVESEGGDGSSYENLNGDLYIKEF